MKPLKDWHMKVIVGIAVFFSLIIICNISAGATPTPTPTPTPSPEQAAWDELHCDKDEVRLLALESPAGVALLNLGDCTFIGGFNINGNIKIGGGAHPAGMGQEQFASPVVITKCQLRLTIPSMKLPCEGFHIGETSKSLYEHKDETLLETALRLEAERAQALRMAPVAPQIDHPVPISTERHQVSEQASAAGPRAAAPIPGETKETAIEMTFEELTAEVMADPRATSDRLTGKWVQLTGRLNGHTGRSGGIGVPSIPYYDEILPDYDVIYSFGIGSSLTSVNVRCRSSMDDIKMRDFNVMPMREVTVAGIYRQPYTLSPKLESCEVVQDGEYPLNP
jgi:hypothetical protein